MLTPHIGENEEQPNTHSLLIGLSHSTITLENSLAVSLKVQYTPIT